MRAPFQTLTILYRKENNEVLYGIFLRKKERIWQFVSGGGEDKETPTQTVKREIWEETGLKVNEEDIIKLDSRTTIPVVNIEKKFLWGENVYVVPEYTFAIELNKDTKIILSDEHEKMEWVNYNNAMKKLKYDSNKTALWELNARLKNRREKMNNLKQFSEEQIVKMIKENRVSVSDLVDSGICPTCFDKRNNHILYGDNKDKMLYEDEKFDCFLVGNPRAEGHTAISTKKHFKDMMEIDDETCKEIFILAKKVMITLKEVYNSESVYLCTMCDGTMNHFHIQLIPRYSFEKRGSKNFVKPRMEYKENKEKIESLRELLENK